MDNNDISFNEYQTATGETAIYPGQGTLGGLMYLALGLSGEAGEFAEKVKKLVRNYPLDTPLSAVADDVRILLVKEIGDVNWYAARGAAELGTPYADAARDNLDKVFDRKDRGILHSMILESDGDRR
jgi:NTP pyrophosphatase (non-canonical NTP hydrolase)